MWKLIGTGSRKGTSTPSRAGDALRQPVVWAAIAVGLALSGPDGRLAARRGTACSVTASVIHLPIKRLFDEPGQSARDAITGAADLLHRRPR